MRTVVIDGVEIPEALIAEEAQNHPGESAADARAQAGHALAIKALLLARAAELELDADAELDDEGREETRDEALIRALLEAELEIAAPSEAECRRVYDADRGRFTSPPLYEASHILIEIPDQTSANVAAARASAMRLITRIASGSDSFADLARDHSDCPSGGTRGSLGQLQPGQVAGEVERALDALSPGEVSAEPVRSRFGWHILRLDHRVAGRVLPFEIVEPQIRLHLESRAWAASAARYVADLAARARSRGVSYTVGVEGTGRPQACTLGDMLSDRLAATRLPIWLAATDPDLAGRLTAAAGDTPIADFVQHAVAEFVAEANDEVWTQLISAAQGADDPALAALAALVRRKVAPAKRTFTVIRRSGS